MITRLEQDDKKKAFTPEPISAAPQVRRASTSTETPTEVPGIPSTAEPNYPKYNLDITIPDAAEPVFEPPVPIVCLSVVNVRQKTDTVHVLAVRPRLLELLRAQA